MVLCIAREQFWSMGWQHDRRVWQPLGACVAHGYEPGVDHVRRICWHLGATGWSPSHVPVQSRRLPAPLPADRRCRRCSSLAGMRHPTRGGNFFGRLFRLALPRSRAGGHARRLSASHNHARQLRLARRLYKLHVRRPPWRTPPDKPSWRTRARIGAGSRGASFPVGMHAVPGAPPHPHVCGRVRGHLLPRAGAACRRVARAPPPANGPRSVASSAAAGDHLGAVHLWVGGVAARVHTAHPLGYGQVAPARLRRELARSLAHRVGLRQHADESAPRQLTGMRTSYLLPFLLPISCLRTFRLAEKPTAPEQQAHSKSPSRRPT